MAGNGKEFVKQRYFAAQNSERGFVGFFDENLRRRADRTFIVKGGPGTGKSRLMEEAARAAEAAGAEVEYYHCSSDPQSLDGIFARLHGVGSFCMIDGTAPHTADTVFPGVRDSFVDLGAFWNPARLTEKRTELEMLNDGKRSAYTRAYLCLSAAGALTRAADALVRGCIDTAAVAAAAEKLPAAAGNGAEYLRSPLAAYGMRGYAEFDTFAACADGQISICDSSDLGCTFLFVDAAARRFRAERVAPDPLCPDKCAAALLGAGDGTRLAVVGVREASAARGEVFDMADYLSESRFRTVREEFSMLRRQAARAVKSALAALAEAARYHFATEKIYSSAMDFAAKERFSAEICALVLSRDLYGR